MKKKIQWILKPILKRREAIIQARRRANIDYCLQREDFKYEDLIPILDEEYDQLVADLEVKIAKEKADEPFHDFCWSEIVASMKMRRRDAYHLNYPCRECGRTNLPDLLLFPDERRELESTQGTGGLYADLS
jgi:hypothetical protein